MLEKAVEEKSKNEGRRRGVWVLKLKWLGGKGWPDHTLLAHGGRIAFVEFKREKGHRFQPLQPWVRKKLISFGFRYALVKTNREVMDFYKEWLDEA